MGDMTDHGDVATLRAELDRLRRRVEELDDSTAPPDERPDSDGAVDRRGWIKGVAATAGVAVAGGVAAAAASSRPVAAGGPEPLNLGVQNTEASFPTWTSFTGSSGGDAAFRFRDGPTAPSPTIANLFPTALAGFATRSNRANGVYGATNQPAGTGVAGVGAPGYGGIFVGTTSALAIANGSPTPPPQRTDAHQAGEIDCVLADNGQATFWICVASGTPGTWRQLGSVAAAGAFNAISPARVYDSRAGQQPLNVTKGALSPGESRVVDGTVNNSGVPAGATAVAINLTAANTQGFGNLSVSPNAGAPPATSSINYTPGVNIANGTVSGCGPGATIRVGCGGAAGTDFLVDVVGYYA